MTSPLPSLQPVLPVPPVLPVLPVPPVPPFASVEAAHARFAELAGQAAQAGITLRAPPPEPTTCCGRGCNGCVWEGWYAAASWWCEESLLKLDC